MTDELVDTIKALAGASTADLIGVAPGSEFSAEELGELGRTFGPVHSVIVLAQRVVDPVQLVRFSSGVAYRSSQVATSFADALLSDACWRVAEMLRGAGWGAAIPRALRYGAAEPAHRIHFKKAAVLAGFGAFGRNQLVIHPKWGPWLMLRTVITDAVLPHDVRLDFRPCDGCRACVDACPSGALSDEGIDRDVCRTRVGELADSNPDLVQLSLKGRVYCEECMRACPVGEAPPRLDL